MSDLDTLQPNEPGNGGSTAPGPSSPAPETQPPAAATEPSPYDSAETQPQQPSPAPRSEPELMLPPGKPGRAMPKMPRLPRLPNPRMLLMLAAAVVIIAAIGFAAIHFTQSGQTTSSTTTATTVSTVATTSVSQVNVANINNCTTISRPGTYFLAHNVNTSITQGACITVASGNVKLVGNGNSVTGSGPYSGVGPYTYGIFLDRVSNVTVTGFRVLRFDYDIYFNKSSGSAASGNNFTKPTISGVYLSASLNNTVMSNYVSQSDSAEGGITLAAGSNGNKVINNTVSDNADTGIVINSTGNLFSRNRLLRNPVDLACSDGSALRMDNVFSNSTCSVNDYCEFAQCTSNLPYNLSRISLPQGSVRSCGQVYYPGSYSLAANLSASDYLNTSRPLERAEACIRIAAPNVNLTCGGKSISGSGYGVLVSSTYNATVTRCTMSNDTYGLAAENTFGSYVDNVTAMRSAYGIYLQNVTSGRVSNVLAADGTYGIYLNLTNGVTFANLDARGNRFGVYAASGGSDVFKGGSLANNTKIDLACTAGTYNSTDNLVQDMACGLTDCSWQGTSACRGHVLPSLLAYPLSACQPITSPGNYSLSQGILARGDCFDIRTDNVIFDCGGHSMLGTSTGSAFALSNRTNVTISDCKISEFGTGVNASGSNQIVLRSLAITNVSQGVRLKGVSGANVANVTVKLYYLTAFNFTATGQSTVTQNYASNGANGASGFVFSGATNDMVSFNNAGPNPGYGFALTGFSGDSFYNNSAFDNVGSDYYCSQSSAGYYANPLGINLGLTKNACRWLIEVPKVSMSPGCQAVSSASDIVLTGDMVYPFGGTCFSVYGTRQSTGNGTVINCNGYTVYAQHGGTFANIVNASGVTVEGCLLSNFTTAISASGPHATIQNNTVLGSGTAVLVSGSRFAKVAGNRMQNDTAGIAVANAADEAILSNRMYETGNAIWVSGGTDADIENNTASLGVYGLAMSNTTSTIIKNNLLTDMSVSGMYCTGTSATNTAQNHDYGGNQCSSNRNCTWVTSSPQCLP